MLDATLLAKLDGVRAKPNGGHLARCPLHDDDKASLSLDEGRDGKLLVKCFAGCDSIAILKHLSNGKSDQPPPERRIVYSYYSADGELLYQVIRQPGKDFRQRRPDGKGGWAWHLSGCHGGCKKHAYVEGDVERTLYNLPDVLDAARQGGAVWIVEGEKDAESVARAGEVATTSGAAGSWQDHLADHLRGARVIICPDNDEPGENYARAIAESLERRHVPFRIVRVPAPHHDISDYLGADGKLARLLTPTVAEPNPTKPLTVPRLDETALYGLPGEWVRAMEPFTEANPVALLTSLLTACGAMIGPGPVVEISPGERHGPRLFTCIVGKSGLGRKGTSWGNVANLMYAVDRDFMEVRGQASGFGSGEAFIDAIQYPEGRSGDEDDDDGDRRLLVVDTEMGATLRTIERQGSNLGHQLRKAWDGTPLQTHSRGHGSRVLRQHHVAMIGHITPHDLGTVRVEDLMNGFAGRFLYAYVERARVISRGAGMPSEQTTEWGRRFALAIDRARTRGVMVRDPGADALYRPWYESLRTDYDEPLDALMARAPNHVMRIALIYALLDGAPTIRAPHMEAAFALWAYCEGCLHLLFGPRGLVPSARRRVNATEADLGIAYNAIVAAGKEGLTVNELSAILGGMPTPSIVAHVNELETRGMVVRRNSPKGRTFIGKEVLKK